MDYTKEIRPDDKKRGAAPAGCRAALWPSGVCLPFWGPEMQGGRAAAGVCGAAGGVQGAGVMAWRGWMGRAMIRRQFGDI